MIRCEFRVHMACTDMEGRQVLVFLRPVAPSADFRVHAWQQLSASAGATERFCLETRVGACLLTAGSGEGQQIVSPLQTMLPGELYHAVSANGLSPRLQRASSADAVARLTPAQVGVRNLTQPYQSVTCVWHVDGSPVVSVPAVDWGMTSSFEFHPELYFMVAARPLLGVDFSVQLFSDLTRVPLAPDTSQVQVEVSRQQGGWQVQATTA